MKKMIAILLAISLLFSLSACAPSTPTEQATVPETGPVSHPLYPMTLTDQAGRQVIIPSEPHRLVSSYYITTSAFIALGLQNRVVGVETNPEKRPIYGLCAPELLSLPMVGTAKELDLESCIALNPDLVVLPLRQKAIVPQLEELDIPVLLVNPESTQLLPEMIDLIGTAANVPERALALRNFIAAQEARLSALSGEKPTVYLGGNSAFLSTAGNQMYQSGLIELAGGQNVAAELPDTYWAEISYEQLLAWDPEYMILAADAAYTVEDVLADPSLSDCRAVRSGKVFRIPNRIESWDSPVPGSILGALWLASVLHSDEITPDETTEIISTFYDQFYGFTYTAE